jgi:tRNA A37 methylthiotransferase MiaB
MKKVCVSFVNGCPRMLLDAARLVDYFQANGWEITTRLPEADMILMGACAVEAETEKSSMKYLSLAEAKKKDGLRLVVFGCIAGINEALIHQHHDAKVMTCGKFDQLDSIIEAKVKIKDIKDPNDIDNHVGCITNSFTILDHFRAKNKFKLTEVAAYKLLSKFQQLRFGRKPAPTILDGKSFHIRVGRGCLGHCTYCAIKNAVGTLQSKPLEAVLTEFQAALSNEYPLIRLIGEDVGAYGQDLGTDVVELFKGLFSFNGQHDYRLAIDDFSLKWFAPYSSALTDLFCRNKDKIAYLGLEIQSGSERILQLMQREYTAADAGKAIHALKEACPELDLRTHVLVGFPGETERDFLDTVDFLKFSPFKHISMYKYSDRPNTIASGMPNKIPEKIKMQRIRKLIYALDGRAFLAG